MQNEVDVVVANSVFFYFPDHMYAQAVLNRMVQMAKKSVGVLDVPDFSKRDYALSLRREQMGDTEYEEKYKGLDHLYYSKDWFKQSLANTAVKVHIEDQDIPGCINSHFRFNVFLHKQ